jgi:SAM-dependent methyltransferase
MSHTSALRADDAARLAYDEMAVVYDAFTAAYDYERWLAAIEALALRHGMAGRRALDVACGTGKSFLPLVDRGYRVTACDISPEMAAIARAKSEGRADVVVADMRQLPDLGRFDLITCIDDSVNYLLSDGELRCAVGSMAGLLRPGGVLVFDCNSLKTYRSAFAQTVAFEQGGVFFCWQGETDPSLPAHGRASAVLEAFAESAGRWRRCSARHEQRHHSLGLVTDVCAEAGLAVEAVLGQRPGIQLDQAADEQVHTKFLYIARREA